MRDRLTDQEQHDRLQEAWSDLSKILAHCRQDDYETDVEERAQDAIQQVGDVIQHLHVNTDVVVDTDLEPRYQTDLSRGFEAREVRRGGVGMVCPVCNIEAEYRSAEGSPKTVISCPDCGRETRVELK